MMYNLFLDDVRQPSECVHYMHRRIGPKNPIYINWDWVVVKSYKEFVKHITENGLPAFISFDHDLADVFYDFMTQKEYFEYHEHTGMDCLKWVCEYVTTNNLNFPDYAIHSMNEVGAENMQSYINSYLKSLK